MKVNGSMTKKKGLENIFMKYCIDIIIMKYCIDIIIRFMIMILTMKDAGLKTREKVIFR